MKPEDTEPRQSGGSGSSPLLTPHSSLLTHSIRLGPPWQTTATDTHTRHARKFGRPRALDANERVWLVCEQVPGAVEVRVNGSAVGTSDAGGPFAADVTAHLRPRNEVVFVVAADGPLGAVVLEIRSV